VHLPRADVPIVDRDIGSSAWPGGSNRCTRCFSLRRCPIRSCSPTTRRFADARSRAARRRRSGCGRQTCHGTARRRRCWVVAYGFAENRRKGERATSRSRGFDGICKSMGKPVTEKIDSATIGQASRIAPRPLDSAGEVGETRTRSSAASIAYRLAAVLLVRTVPIFCSLGSPYVSPAIASPSPPEVPSAIPAATCEWCPCRGELRVFAYRRKSP